MKPGQMTFFGLALAWDVTVSARPGLDTERHLIARQKRT
jgi:hypothetical protein